MPDSASPGRSARRERRCRHRPATAPRAPSAGPLRRDPLQPGKPCSRDTAAEERLRPRDGRLVGLAEVLERGERLVRVLALPQLEGIEAAAFQEEQEIPRDMA